MSFVTALGGGEGARPPRLRAWCFAGALAAALLISPLRLGVVSGDSMSPSLHSGQFYVMDRAYYRTRSVERGDVVVFRQDGETYMKRVLAVGGDSIYLVRYTNSRAVDLVPEWQLEKLRRLSGRKPWSKAIQLVEKRIPEGHCYVVGDHLPTSLDSRTFGAIPLSAVQGRVLKAPPPQPEMEQFAGHFRLRRGA